jgi:anthranilate synthase component 1
VREVPADLDTPVSVYLKLAGTGPSFLLESVTGGEQVARYSFIGVSLHTAYVLRGHTLTLHQGAVSEQVQLPTDQDPLDLLRSELAQYHLQDYPGLPRFVGGLVGYLGYDTVRFFESTVPAGAHERLPDAIYLLADTLVTFDHAYGRVLLITNVPAEEDGPAAREAAQSRLDHLEAQLAESIPHQTRQDARESTGVFHSNQTQDQFMAAVEKAKEYIYEGDIFQVVLSQQLSRKTTAAPFDIYRTLRRLNPSPYMFYFDFENLAGDFPFRLIGASPEMHVRLEGHRASVRPIAGTRPRGANEAEDQVQEADLLADPKERAEHVMLVDLARNDLGRVCAYGSVEVQQKMIIERYSHVMHIASHVEGDLHPTADAFDLMRATFPAGTVSGAPKIRAMQIIEELEGTPRGPYAGAVGYFSFDGSLDTCITIRTLTMVGDTVTVQAGAGIVADSDPGREYQETLNKARALGEAVDRAEAFGRLDPS